MGEDKIAWSAKEYEYRKRSPDWFWAVGLVGLALAVVAIVLNNVLLGVLIAISTFALIISAVKKPEVVDFEINKRGVSVGGKLYLYDSLESFYVIQEAENPKLLLKSEKVMMPLITIPISGVGVKLQEIVDYLGNHLAEEEMHEPISQKIAGLLGF